MRAPRYLTAAWALCLAAGLGGCPEPPPLDLAKLPRVGAPPPRPAPAIAPLPAAPAGPTDRGDFVVLTSIQRLGANRFATTRVAQILRKTGIIQELVQAMNASIALPRDVIVEVKPCGAPSPHYDPDAVRIALCDEAFEMLEALFQQYPEGQFEPAVLGAIAFIFLHEASHALVHQLGLSVYASEENVADALASWLAINTNAARYAFAGVDAFALLGATRGTTPIAFWDEHAPDEVRAYNIMCQVYGSDPVKYAGLVQAGLLPSERAERCPGEYQQTATTVLKEVGPHLLR